MNDSQPELETGRSAPVHPSPGWTAQLQLLIFDLDGVITSEARYWQTARLTVWDLITQPDFLGLRDYWGADLRDPEAVLAAGDQVIAPTFIAELKRRGINSNWDLTFFVLSLQAIAILAQLCPPLPPRFWGNPYLYWNLAVAFGNSVMNNSKPGTMGTKA